MIFLRLALDNTTSHTTCNSHVPRRWNFENTSSYCPSKTLPLVYAPPLMHCEIDICNIPPTASISHSVDYVLFNLNSSLYSSSNCPRNIIMSTPRHSTPACGTAILFLPQRRQPIQLSQPSHSNSVALTVCRANFKYMTVITHVYFKTCILHTSFVFITMLLSSFGSPS